MTSEVLDPGAIPASDAAAAPVPASPAAHAAEVLSGLTLEEKVAQIIGFWDKGDGEAVAPLQGAFTAPQGLLDVAVNGLGQLTRPYGTRPVDPTEHAAWLWDFQRWLVENTRPAIPALVHEECLTGLAAWKAATFPTPLAWGASFDPALVEEMAETIGACMRELGIHQGLAPVLDVIRDPRWGRVEECISEDPYHVGETGSAYVRGLQAGGVHATLKHFVGYSNSQGGRNFGPVHAGPRELADVFMEPFEMAVRDAGAKSVMHAYNEIDGIPVASNPEILTKVLRDEWGFDGTVVADYFGVAFLNLLHHIAADHTEAAALALEAGVDVELPTGDAYLLLVEAVRAGTVDEALVDRACLRALTQKAELGLLGNRFDSEPPHSVDLDTPEQRRIARTLAEESLVLLANDGTLPLAAPAKVAVIGPNVSRQPALFGCYSFANHVISQNPGTELGFEAPTLEEALRKEWPSAEFTVEEGCRVDDDDRSGISAAVETARTADVVVLGVGDQSGLFGRGTVGEGCDRDSLELPGVQRELVEAVLETGAPVVLVLLTGRPYAIDWALESCAAVVQAFFPGEEGASAISGVLSGRVNPSGRLPVSLPRSAGSQPYSYLHPRLGGDSDVTNLSSTPARPFGFGLSYGSVETALTVTAASTSEPVHAEVLVTNTGERDTTEVVQLYVHDVVGSVSRPVAQLVGFARVEVPVGESRTVRFDVPPRRLAFTGRDGVRAVEPGEFEFWVGDSATGERVSVELSGERHPVSIEDRRSTRVEIS